MTPAPSPARSRETRNPRRARRFLLSVVTVIAIALPGVVAATPSTAATAPAAPDRPTVSTSGASVSVNYGFSGDQTGLTWRATLIPSDGHDPITQNDDDRNTVFENVPNGSYTAVAYAVRGSDVSAASQTSASASVTSSSVGWPDAPANVVSTVDGSSALITWANPNATGGTPITTARVTVTSDDGVPTSKDVTTTSARFDTLASGSYAVSVQVKNSYVWSNRATTSFRIGDDPLPQPLVDYAFSDAAAGATSIKNSGSAGAKYDARVVNAQALRSGTRDGGTSVAFPGGARGTADASMPYLQIPNGVYEGLSAVTVATWIKWDGKGATSSESPWAFILGGDRLAQQNFGTFLSPSENGRLTVGAASSASEAKANSVRALPVGTWTHVAIALDGTSLVLYVNGVESDRRPASIDFAKLFSSASTFSGLIGRTQWSAQYASFFGGELDDFEVYSRALSSSQVAQVIGAGKASITGYTPAGQQTVQTSVGVPPTLPTITGQYSDGIDRPLVVDWDSIDPARYASAGEFIVSGRIVASDNAVVTVKIQVLRPTPMKIDAGASTGAFTGGASGTLYGVYGEDLPSNNLVEGVHLTSIATKSQDGRQHPGADAYEALKNMVDSTGGGTVYIYMPDTYYGGGYPVTRFDDGLNQPGASTVGGSDADQLAEYVKEVRRQVLSAQKLEPKYRDNIVWIPFNEPEGIPWVRWNNGTFYNAWDTVFREIRAIDPTARIAGPNTTHLREVRDFFGHTIAADTVPDVYTWHELSSPGVIRVNVAAYRQQERDAFAGTKYAGKQLPININEYAYRYHTSVPGQMIQWMSAIEDTKVEGDVAYWNVDGNLNDQAVETNRGNGSWWLYNAYGEMTGDTVAVTPPSTDSYTLQGISTVDTTKRQSRTIVGGATGYQTLAFSNLSTATFGTSVQVRVEEIPWTGQLGDSAQPDLVGNYVATIGAGGTLDVVFDGASGSSVPAMREGSAYEVILSPAANAATQSDLPVNGWHGVYEAESAKLSGAAVTQGPNGGPSNVGAFYTSGGYNIGGFSTGATAAAEFTVTVPADGTYDTRLFGQTTFLDPQSPNGRTNVYLTVDGKTSEQKELFLPVTYKDYVWDYAPTSIALTKGTHTIAVSTKGASGSTVGNGRIDRLDLIAASQRSAAVYEAEFAELSARDSVRYDSKPVGGSGTVELAAGNRASFFTYAAEASESAVTFTATGTGAADLVVNGITLGSLTGTATRSFALEAGVNKIEVVGTSGALRLDRIALAAPSSPTLPRTRYQAEDSSVARIGAGAPDTRVADYSLAQGGKAVTGIGGTYAGDTSKGTDKNTLTFTVNATQAGVHALTIRYSNDVASAASHYNPDTLALHAQVSVNGTAPSTVWFANTLSKNQFFTTTTYVMLKAGSNTVSFSSRELPNFGETDQYLSEVYPPTGSLLFRSAWAPQIDWIEVGQTANVAAVPAADIAVTSRCVAGKAILAVRVLDTDTIPLDVSMRSTFGTKVVAGLQPGKTTTQSFTTRLVSMPAGSVTVSLSGVRDGTPVTANKVVPYSALRCG